MGGGAYVSVLESKRGVTSAIFVVVQARLKLSMCGKIHFPQNWNLCKRSDAFRKKEMYEKNATSKCPVAELLSRTNLNSRVCFWKLKNIYGLESHLRNAIVARRVPIYISL